jgi:hypothetical protein
MGLGVYGGSGNGLLPTLEDVGMFVTTTEQMGCHGFSFVGDLQWAGFY